MHIAIVKNTVYQIIAKVFTSGVGFLITILIARTFGASGFGDFVKITSYIAFFYLAIDLGLNAVYLQVDKEEKKFKNFFYGRIFIAFLIFIISNVLTFILPYNQNLDIGFSPLVRLSIFIFSFSFFCQGIIFSTSALFQKRMAYAGYMWSIILGSIANLLLVYFFTSLNYSLLYVIFSFIVSNFITALASILFVKIQIFPIDFNWDNFKSILIKAWPISVMLIFNLVYFRADSFLLALFKESKDVGIYGLSYKFFDFFIAVPLFLSNSIYPLLLQNKKNFRKFKNLIKIYLFVFIFLGILFLLVFWFISPLFSLIRSEYSSAVLPFRILLLSLPIFFATSFLQWIFISLEKQKMLMKLYVIAAIFNIFLNLIFIPRYSYLSSAIITGVSELFVFIVLLFFMFNLKIFSENNE